MEPQTVPNPSYQIAKRIDAICAYLGVRMVLCEQCGGEGSLVTSMHPCGCCLRDEGGECDSCKGTGWKIK